MSMMPTVVDATYKGEYLIDLRFSDGSRGTVDFQAWLEGPVFEPLKDREYFARFFLDGGTIAWPNGADIAPEALYEQVHAGRPA